MHVITTYISLCLRPAPFVTPLGPQEVFFVIKCILASPLPSYTASAILKHNVEHERAWWMHTKFW
jgi:hypothetical protein